MIRFATALIFLAAPLAQAAPQAVHAPVYLKTDQILSIHACRKQALPVLSKWKSLDQWTEKGMPNPTGTSYASPTETIGKWITLFVGEPGKPLGAALTERSGSAITEWSAPDCVPKISFRKGPAPSKKPEPGLAQAPLTDDDVRKIVTTHPTGVFYVWSPEMPLSVNGYKNIEAACKKLGANLTPILHPSAGVPQAKKALAKAKDPATKGLAKSPKSTAFEFQFRHLYLHAPSILIFKEGRFIGHVVPGVMPAKDYEELIRERLELASGSAAPSKPKGP